MERLQRDRPPTLRRRAGILVLASGASLAVVAIALVAGAGPGTPGGPPKALGAPQFVEESADAGVDHRYDGEFAYYVGGGVAVFDCDGDGRDDLYIAGGTEKAALFRNESPVGGRLLFSRVTNPAADVEAVTGAYPLDIDGDANADLAVLRHGEDVLLRGTGGCRFERANERWGFDGGDLWTAAFSATWEAHASLPTLAFGNYLTIDEAGRTDYSCADGAFVRPEGPARYGVPLALSPSWCTLSMLFSDWDRSGRRDLRVSNDRHYYRDGEEQLWRVAAGEVPRLYTREEGWQKLQIFGMGIASQDLTGDGMPEVYLTSQADNKLQTLAEGPARPTYRDIALRSGATAHRPFAGGDIMPSTAWHAEFDDVNNDGFVDLFVAKGNVEAQTDHAARDPSNLLLGQPDGTFVEGAEAAGIVRFTRARGAGLADLNLDGLLDLVVVNRRANVSLWRNVGTGDAAQSAAMGNWLAVRPSQPAPNRDAVGAWIELRAASRSLEREVTVGGGHASGQLGWVHFGLADAERAEVRVRWPDGEVGPWLSVSANRFVAVERGAREVREWRP